MRESRLIQRGNRGAWIATDGYVLEKGGKATRELAGEVVLRVVCGECAAKVGEVRRVPWGSTRGRFGKLLDPDGSLEVLAQGPVSSELQRAVVEVRRVAKRAAPPQPRWYWSRLDAERWYRFCCRRDGVGQLDGDQILDAVELHWRSVAAPLC